MKAANSCIFRFFQIISSIWAVSNIMKPSLLQSLSLLLSIIQQASAADWPSWRGPLGIGVSEEKELPTQWSATNHVKWRVPLPEPGNSTPIVWGEKVFVTQAVGEKRTLICFNRANGAMLWQTSVLSKEKEPTHATNPYCSASPVTDGERVIVSFASDGLYCYDFAGKELWHRTDLGQQVHIWGGGASPAIYQDACFLNFGPGETTYLLAVDKKTGKTVWKHDERTAYKHPKAGEESDVSKTYLGSWTTPTIMKVEGRPQLLMDWPGRLAAYEPASGKEIWTCAGLNPLSYTSPIYENRVAVAMGGFGGMSIGVRAGGEGDITATRRLWHHPKTKQRIGSGVVHEGHIYIHNDPGVAECFELDSGKLIWEERLKGKGPSGVNWSSVMLANGNCYTITQGGDCFVFKASPRFEIVSVNPLGEPSNSSVVPAYGELLIRTHRALWCISEKK
jgi:outer membrane protein assembly factor BamB